MSEPTSDELGRVKRERDLFRALLELGSQERLEPLLEHALALVVSVTGASQGYIEVRDPSGEENEATWWLGHACSDDVVDQIRATVSRGIIAEALASGRTILTHSAVLDERFRGRESVRARRIEAVICAPIGGDASRGVVYIQGRAAPGVFSDEARQHTEALARHLAPFVDRLLVRRQTDRALDATQQLRARYQIGDVIGRGPAIAQALEQAMLAAPLDVSVLLTGPSGSGKSLLARAIHTNSRRAGGAFVELNCAALPENLIESELFGALAGSHSEAHRNQPGKVAAAEGGTLFLDEIGEIPYAAQSKLLQLLQSKQYYPLGSPQAVHADVRLIAASNDDLHEAVRKKRFREDLLYRLQVLPVRMPALAERPEDLPALAEHLVAAACRRHGLAPLRLGAAGIRAIQTGEWPGNVRELEHTIEAAAIRAAGEEVEAIEARHLFPTGERAAEGGGELNFRDATRWFQRELLERTLRENEWNVAEVTRKLGLARSHVYNLIRAFELGRAEGE
ncbi:MAG: sigma-54-dependent Fis family transcriptional regulator [Myxococcota bacterium]